MPSSFAAACSCWNIFWAVEAGSFSGSKSVPRNHLGVPPDAAMSLAFTWIAYQPIRSVAKVIGSDFAIRVVLPNETNAASSPTPGPSRMRYSFGGPRSLRKLASISGGSFPAFSRLLASSSVISVRLPTVLQLADLELDHLLGTAQ